MAELDNSKEELKLYKFEKKILIIKILISFIKKVIHI